MMSEQRMKSEKAASNLIQISDFLRLRDFSEFRFVLSGSSVISAEVSER